MRTDRDDNVVSLRFVRPATRCRPIKLRPAELRARRSWRPLLLALGYPACFALGALVALLGARP